MLELITTFTPADGSAPRTITLRIGDPYPNPDHDDWCIMVDILGFGDNVLKDVRLRQVDWPNAIRDAALFVTNMVTWKVKQAGGGTLDPHIWPQEDDEGEEAAKPEPQK